MRLCTCLRSAILNITKFSKNQKAVHYSRGINRFSNFPRYFWKNDKFKILEKSSCKLTISIYKILVMVFSTNYYMLTAGSAGLGFFVSALGTYTLPMELMPAKRRWIVGVWTTQMTPFFRRDQSSVQNLTT